MLTTLLTPGVEISSSNPMKRPPPPPGLAEELLVLEHLNIMGVFPLGFL